MKQIMVAFTAGETPALGNIWRITAKKTDFYIDFYRQAGSVAHYLSTVLTSASTVIASISRLTADW
jgi:hypothetical protein